MKPKSPRTTGRGFSSSSLIASAAIHGGLVVGVVAVGTWGHQSESREHVYRLAFEQAVVAHIAPETEAFEALAPVESHETADLDSELEPQVRSVPVREQEDPKRFNEPGALVVLPPDMPDTREFVFGPRIPPAVETPSSEAPPQVETPQPEATPPAAESTAEPVDIEYVRLAGDEPEYPRASVRLGEEGDVVLALKVNADGEVVSVELRTSSSHRRLDQAAMTAALTWRFPKGTPSAIQHTVHFRLQP